jgi:hypothetical protein
MGGRKDEFARRFSKFRTKGSEFISILVFSRSKIHEFWMQLRPNPDFDDYDTTDNYNPTRTLLTRLCLNDICVE